MPLEAGCSKVQECSHTMWEVVPADMYIGHCLVDRALPSVVSLFMDVSGGIIVCEQAIYTELIFDSDVAVTKAIFACGSRNII